MLAVVAAAVLSLVVYFVWVLCPSVQKRFGKEKLAEKEKKYGLFVFVVLTVSPFCLFINV